MSDIQERQQQLWAACQRRTGGHGPCGVCQMCRAANALGRSSSSSLTQAKEAIILRLEKLRSRGRYPEAQAANHAFDTVAGLVEDGEFDALIQAVSAEQAQAELERLTAAYALNQQQAQTIERLTAGVTLAIQAIKSLDVEALGMGTDGECEWPLRDEVLTNLRLAIRAEAAEARVPQQKNEIAKESK